MHRPDPRKSSPRCSRTPSTSPLLSSSATAIASRCWSRAMLISGRCMSCAPPPPAVEAFSRASASGAPAPAPAAGSELSALDLTLRALRPLLADPEVTELCINRPREIFIETRAGWRGVFRSTRRAGVECDAAEQELLRLHAEQEFPAFMRLAVRARKNIVVSGATGSGKTTWNKALIREIPCDERLVTIEDARELVLEGHPNHVRLFYSKDDQGLARVTPKQLLECC